MWIELPDELIEFTEKISNPLDRSIVSINTLFDSMLKCQHIIYGSYELLDHLEKHTLISQANKKFINWIKQRYTFVYECSEALTCKIVISIKENEIERKEENSFIVPLNYFYETRETKLLTENTNDAELFKNIYIQMACFKKMSPNFSIRFENDPFHGGNAPLKIKNAAEKGRMMVCLVDSDKDYISGKSGSTYKGAISIYKQLQNHHMIYMKQLNVREKENLIPPSLYLKVLNEKNDLLEIMQKFIVDENIIRYFDIKDGVKFEIIKDEKWIKYYQKIIDECKERGIFREPSEEEPDKEKYVCIKGIGAKLCDVVNEILLECDGKCEENMKHHSIKKEKRESIYDCRTKIIENLPEYLLEEWDQIHVLLFTWGCCLSENIFPSYSFE